MLLLAAILAEAILVSLTLWATHTGNHRLEWFAKLSASAVFLGVGLVRWTQGSIFDSFMVLGLGLGMAGDILLVGRRTFRLGLLAFLAGHTATIAAFGLALPWTSWPFWLVIPLAALGGVIARWLWAHTAHMRAPVMAYVLVISVLMWGGLSVSIAGVLPATAGVGAVFFAVSDLAVARHRFIQENFLNRAIGLPLYYAGQLMLAWTVGTL